MSEEGKKGENKRERRFSQEQYDMLKRCSDAKDMTEWNEWRGKNPHEAILLEGADLYKCYLQGAFLNKAVVVDHSGRMYEFDREIPQNEAASYIEKYENSGEVHLENANLRRAYLKDALLYEAWLEGADLSDTYLENVEFWRTDIRSATFHTSVVDGTTLFWRCKVNYNTDFRGVAIESMRIDPETKHLLKYNIRRKNWEEWYKEHRLLAWLVKPFWLMSDYGLSTSRVVVTFFALAISFATVYFVWGALDYYYLGIKDQPGIVEELFVPVAAEDAVSDVTYLAMVYFRSIYFSIVTMTTLGFGDMYANATRCEWRWWFGHLLLMVQVILGYVLLAALVTRFAVLFTAGGPAGKFAKEKKK